MMAEAASAHEVVMIVEAASAREAAAMIAEAASAREVAMIAEAATEEVASDDAVESEVAASDLAEVEGRPGGAEDCGHLGSYRGAVEESNPGGAADLVVAGLDDCPLGGHRGAHPYDHPCAQPRGLDDDHPGDRPYGHPCGLPDGRPCDPRGGHLGRRAETWPAELQAWPY